MDDSDRGLLSIRHFDSIDGLKNTTKKWDDLVNEKIVVKCKKCGKWIWSMWHNDCYPNGNKPAKYDSMKLCGPCFFGRGR